MVTNKWHHRISLFLLIAAIIFTSVEQTQAAAAAPESTELVLAPGSGARDGPEAGGGWFVRVLRELFDDIDWQAIEKAREQVEKFVKKVDRLIRTFRGGETGATSRPSSSTAAGDHDDGESGHEARLFPQGKWWNSGAKLTGAMPPTATGAGSLAGELADASDIKQMLERVACFLGYMRILTNSNEALAELDAAKVVSNLFGAASASSGGGFFKRWFG